MKLVVAEEAIVQVVALQIEDLVEANHAGVLATIAVQVVDELVYGIEARAAPATLQVLLQAVVFLEPRLARVTQHGQALSARIRTRQQLLVLLVQVQLGRALLPAHHRARFGHSNTTTIKRKRPTQQKKNSSDRSTKLIIYFYNNLKRKKTRKRES